MISLVVAMGPNREIGSNNQIPWKLSEDLKNFKKTTLGHHILMGRKTFESIGKPLPGRINLILSRNKDFQVKDCITVRSIDEAINYARSKGEYELMVIGGAEIYKEALPHAKRIYLSQVEFSGSADTYFPEFNEKNWKVISEIKHSGDSIPWTFRIIER
ncbi:MAG: dihydrofolate reductase [Bacteriovoracales bacterium]